MQRKLFLFLSVVFLLILAACSSDDAPEQSDFSAEDVAQVDPVRKYQQKCQMCHGENLNDGLEIAKDLTDVGARLTKEEIKKIIIDGAPGMPKAQLKGAELEAVAEWLANMK